jgi:hypothetical protein
MAIVRRGERSPVHGRHVSGIDVRLWQVLGLLRLRCRRYGFDIDCDRFGRRLRCSVQIADRQRVLRHNDRFGNHDAFRNGTFRCQGRFTGIRNLFAVRRPIQQHQDVGQFRMHALDASQGAEFRRAVELHLNAIANVSQRMSDVIEIWKISNRSLDGLQRAIAIQLREAPLNVAVKRLERHQNIRLHSSRHDHPNNQHRSYATN